MNEETEKTVVEYEAWIEANHPQHDRTSCDDNNLYNAGTVMLRHRCERCESLSQLRYFKLQSNGKGKRPAFGGSA